VTDAAVRMGGPAASPSPGVDGLPRRFGPYTLLRRFAVGGMAELFLALKRSVAGFEKLIVVKRVLPELTADPAFVEMLLTEARIAATLNHPNVAHVYDVGEVDGTYYIAMEYIHGQDLRALIRQMRAMKVRGLPLEHALSVVLGCCTGLAYAHERRDLDGNAMGIVHRDVSPQNIVVTFEGDVKLVDFGIAKAEGQTRTYEDTDSGQLKGKIPYMSPEQARGWPLDHRSDIFSLGIILFELCTGRRLFRGKTELETLRRIVDGPIPAPTTFNPHLHPSLEAIILRALQIDREQRYASARQMQADLEAFIRREQMQVSSLSLGMWMRQLFADRLDEQTKLLAEGRQLAEVLIREERLAREAGLPGPASDPDLGLLEAERTGASGVRPRRRSPPYAMVALLALLLLIGSGAAAFFFGRAPAAEAAPTAGVLTVETDPPGARVVLDGRPLAGVTPLTLREVAFGDHDLELSKDGHRSHRAVVALEAEAPRMDVVFALSPEVGIAAAPETTAEGRIMLRVTPADARLRVDGEPVPGEGRDRALTALSPGTHVLEVERRGFRPDRREVQVAAGEAEAVEIDLRRAAARGGSGPGLGGRAEALPSSPPRPAPARTGRLSFGSTPWCNVAIDGRDVGQTPIVNHELPSGAHTVTCSNPDVGTRTVRVMVPPGQTLRRTIRLGQ
jgi:predicted Ser/Thr protein kinase